MSDDPIERLEAHGLSAVPGIDSAFADRLESRLRVQHGSARARRLALLPRLGLAAAAVTVGIIAAVSINTRDAGIPIVVDGDPVAPAPASQGAASAADDGSSSSGEPAGVLPPPPPTPSVAPTGVPATPARPSATVEDGPTLQQGEAPIETPTPSPAPDTTAAPVEPAPTSTPVPRSRPTPSPVAVAPLPVPSAVAALTPTVSVPTPSATPTLAAEAVSFEATCIARVGRAQAGVVCEWTEPVGVEVAGYRILRSRNGGDVDVVATQRAGATRSFTDRDVAHGDTVTYLVQAFAGEQVVAATERIVVLVNG